MNVDTAARGGGIAFDVGSRERKRRQAIDPAAEPAGRTAGAGSWRAILGETGSSAEPGDTAGRGIVVHAAAGPGDRAARRHTCRRHNRCCPRPAPPLPPGPKLLVSDELSKADPPSPPVPPAPPTALLWPIWAAPLSTRLPPPRVDAASLTDARRTANAPRATREGNGAGVTSLASRCRPTPPIALLLPRLPPVIDTLPPAT